MQRTLFQWNYSSICQVKNILNAFYAFNCRNFPRHFHLIKKSFLPGEPALELPYPVSLYGKLIQVDSDKDVTEMLSFETSSSAHQERKTRPSLGLQCCADFRGEATLLPKIGKSYEIGAAVGTLNTVQHQHHNHVRHSFHFHTPLNLLNHSICPLLHCYILLLVGKFVLRFSVAVETQHDQVLSILSHVDTVPICTKTKHPRFTKNLAEDGMICLYI